jgi:putative ABC transport system permease protein
METARWMVDVPDGALEVLVYPTSEDHADVSRMAATLAGVMGPAYTVTPWMVRGIWAQNLPVMESMNVIFSSIVVFVMALAIFNTMTMSVLERTGEIGVMRAMGQSRIGAVLTFLVEAMVIGLIGGVAGALVGTGPALYLEQNGLTYGQDLVDDFGTEIAMKATMSAELTPDILVIAVFVGILTAALGAFFPALRAARIQPHEAMRAQR